MDNRPIGVFDSGVGGITVFSKIIEKLPNENIIYLGDTARLPYGTKSKETIIEYTKQAIEFLIKQNVKAIVIACGTATSLSWNEVKDLYDLPIIGIIKPTVQNLGDDIKTIGVIGTNGTIKSNAWENEIKDSYPNVNVISKACPILAQMAEDGWTENEIAKLVIKEYLAIFKNTDIEKLILGCTHYPLFEKIIKDELDKKIEIIDTGEKCAKFLKELLEEKNLINNENPEYKFYLTDIESNFLEIANKILKDKYVIDSKHIELVKI